MLADETGKITSASIFSQLLEEIAGSSLNKRCANLAIQLSTAARHDPPWTTSYIKSIHYGLLAPSAAILDAVAMMEGYSEKDFSKITVRSTDANMEGVYIIGKVFTCSCGRKFVPNSPNRKRCYICSKPRRK